MVHAATQPRRQRPRNPARPRAPWRRVARLAIGHEFHALSHAAPARRPRDQHFIHAQLRLYARHRAPHLLIARPRAKELTRLRRRYFHRNKLQPSDAPSLRRPRRAQPPIKLPAHPVGRRFLIQSLARAPHAFQALATRELRDDLEAHADESRRVELAMQQAGELARGERGGIDTLDGVFRGKPHAQLRDRQLRRDTAVGRCLRDRLGPRARLSKARDNLPARQPGELAQAPHTKLAQLFHEPRIHAQRCFRDEHAHRLTREKLLRLARRDNRAAPGMPSRDERRGNLVRRAHKTIHAHACGGVDEHLQRAVFPTMERTRRREVHDHQPRPQDLHRGRHVIERVRNRPKDRAVTLRVRVEDDQLRAHRLCLAHAHAAPHAGPARRSVAHLDVMVRRHRHRPRNHARRQLLVQVRGLHRPIRKPQRRNTHARRARAMPLSARCWRAHTSSKRRRCPAVTVPRCSPRFVRAVTARSTPRMRPAPRPMPR